MHCTQSAEAAHKKSAKLTSVRVRHLHGMKTVHSMLHYLCTHTVFEHLKDFFPDPPSNGPAVPIVYGVKTRLENLGGTTNLMAEWNSRACSFTTRRFQVEMIHKEIPVTRVEFMDMLCDQFDLPKSVQTYRQFERLGFVFGQQFTCSSSGRTYWATDTNYTYPNVFNRRVRRDRFFVDGVVKQTYRLQDGRRVERTNSLCAEATCFLTVSKLSQVRIPALDPANAAAANDPHKTELRSSVHNDSITFFLVRWFEPHHTSHERDQLNRPVCPGPLHVNHCLWTYAKTQSPRRSVPQYWTVNKRYAYYGLILPQNVLNRVNMTPCFVGAGVRTGIDWLESVTLI